MSATCLIDYRYRLIKLIGRGGMGSVFRANDERGGREVALKLMDRDLATDDLAARRFRREARICMRMRHPNIVAGLDTGYDADADRHFIAMELVDGPNAARAAERDRMNPAAIIGVIAQIAAALAYAHANDVIHGDVSPGNIVLSGSDHSAKLTDFGLARLRSAAPDVPGRVIGTPRYMAPEVARGDAATELSDLYSLGAVAHWLLTVEFPTLRRRDIPRGVADVIEKALSIDPADRHESLAAFSVQFAESRLAIAA